MPYMTPPSGGDTFTGRTGTTYTSTAVAVEILVGDIALALSRAWVQSSQVTYPSLSDFPQGIVVAYKLYQCSIPFIVAPTGSMAANGAVTLGTALPATYSGGCYLYLPAGAVLAGSAVGWYYAVMSSTTVGTVYINTYTSGMPFIPSSPTGVVGAGPGAFTGVTTAVTGPTYSLVGGTMGPNGMLELYALWGYHGSANNKTTSITVGGTTVFTLVEATLATLSNVSLTTMANQGTQANQSYNTSGYIAAGTGAQSYSTVNTAATQTVAVSFINSTATDYIILDQYQIQLVPG